MILPVLFSKKLQGFTLIELLVSVAIMVIMTAVLLGKYPEATMKITLANANSALVLLVHEAQQRGSSVDSMNNSLGGYGIYFNRATPADVILFGDRINASTLNVQGLPIGNGLYDTGPINEAKSSTHLQSKYSYEKLCVGSTTAPLSQAPNGFLCNATSSPVINTLTVSFSRPSQVAHIYINNSTTTDFASACIQLYSPKSPEAGHIRSLKVYHSGMVITARTSCD